MKKRRSKKSKFIDGLKRFYKKIDWEKVSKFTFQVLFVLAISGVFGPQAMAFAAAFG